ncbi:MAG: ABC transporter substrate-binding protein [Clostridia bacterium]|nr:ABC transporter substrate-binding protein [Clostridia bacterium]
MTRKLVTLFLALALVLTMVPAVAGADELAPVNIDWYFGQDPAPDFELVNQAVNEYLTEKINTTVTFHGGTGDEYWGNMVVRINAGEDLGIIGFGSQTKLDYVVRSQSGAYYPLDGDDALLDTYGEGTKALFDQGVWDAMKIDGHIFGIPTLKDNGFYISLIYNDTMAQELGIDVDGFKFESFRDVEALGYEVKEKRDAAHPEWAEYPVFWNVGNVHPYNFAIENFLNGSFFAVCNVPGIDTIEGYDNETVFNLYDTPEFLEFAIQKQKMVDDGIYLYDYTDKREQQYTGAVFGWVGWGYTYMEEHMYGDNFVTKMRMFDKTWTDTNNYFSAGTAISSHCAEPARAMMVLNLVNTDPDFATMMRFGIEGEHYTYDADGKMTFEGTKNAVAGERAYYYWYMAPIGNLTIVRAPETLTGPDSVMLKNMMALNDSCIKAQHLGFSFDTAPVTNQVAACTSVELEYRDDLVLGQLADADEVTDVVTEFVDKLNANGVADVIAEVQSQIEAWEAAK